MEFVLKAHSGWAYITLVVMALAAIFFFIKFVSKRNLDNKDKKIALAALIATHVQFLLGLILWIPKLGDMGKYMETPEQRLQFVEHPVAMLIAVVLITIAYSKTKKKIQAGAPLGLGQALLFFLGFAVILSRVPWETWLS